MPDDASRSRSRLLMAMQTWGYDSLESLHADSIANGEDFWRRVVADLSITFSRPFTAVRDDARGKELPRWFVGGEINAADLCVVRHASSALASKTAVVYEGDGGQQRSLTYGQLDREVRCFAANLAALGIVKGDRVVLFLPVVPEAVVAFLGCAMIGAVVVPAFSGYGPEALAARLTDSQARVLVTADGTTRRGRVVRLKETADLALASAESVEHVVVVRHIYDGQASMVAGRDRYWDELDDRPAPVRTAPTKADDPLTLIYTSGTTGRPKGIVHSHAGFLVKSAVDFAYGFDVRDDDVIAWTADMGWMLGPLMIMGGLQLGATIVLTEGVPDYPTADRVWRIIERHGVTVQGIAPTAARALMNLQSVPDELPTSLRAFASTGEAWDEPTWWWLFDEVGRKSRPIINYSGGTETGGGILIGYPFLPMEAASFNGPLPGMDVDVLGQDAAPLLNEVGELCVRNTWPGMTHAFWQDVDRYLETYWSRFPGVWVHGDLASRDELGTWRVVGRSDDTIKVSGRRVGPAEIETALLKDGRIRDAAVVGVPDPQRGQRVVAFVVVDDDVDYDHLVAEAVHNVGRSFAPTIHVVRSIPKTKNGKIMRRAIRAQHLGIPAGDLSALDPGTPLQDIPTLDEAGEAR